MAAGLARRIGTRLDLGRRQEEDRPCCDNPVPRRRLAAILVAVAVVVAASGGSTTPGRRRDRRRPVGGGKRRAPASDTGASPAASPAGYTGPAGDDQYSIGATPRSSTARHAIAEAFHAANPDITVKVTVSDWDAYWDKLQTGLAGGAAPDVFAMDGPLFPDYQSRGVLLDLQAVRSTRRRVRPDPAGGAGVGDFTTADGGQYGIPRDSNTSSK